MAAKFRAFTYTTTFYPNTPKFSEAAAGRGSTTEQELGGIDIFLRQVRKVGVARDRSPVS